MKNNKLIVYKENILVKIRNFIKRLMGKNKVSSDKEFNENQSISNITSNVFFENIQIKDNSEERKIKSLQMMWIWIHLQRKQWAAALPQSKQY